MPSYDNDKNIRRDRDVHEMIKCASSIISNEMGSVGDDKRKQQNFLGLKIFLWRFFYSANEVLSQLTQLLEHVSELFSLNNFFKQFFIKVTLDNVESLQAERIKLS